jgi:hypothetical protein
MHVTKSVPPLHPAQLVAHAVPHITPVHEPPLVPPEDDELAAPSRATEASEAPSNFPKSSAHPATVSAARAAPSKRRMDSW